MLAALVPLKRKATDHARAHACMPHTVMFCFHGLSCRSGSGQGTVALTLAFTATHGQLCGVFLEASGAILVLRVSGAGKSNGGRRLVGSRFQYTPFKYAAWVQVISIS